MAKPKKAAAKKGKKGADGEGKWEQFNLTITQPLTNIEFII